MLISTPGGRIDMKFSRIRFQSGSIRKVPRKVGFAWEFRYYETEDGRRKLKVETYPTAQYPTETSVRKAVQPTLRMINADTSQGISKVTVDTVIDRYYKEKIKPGFLALSHSTQQTVRSNIENHIRPYWGKVHPNEIDRAAVKRWIVELPSVAIQSRAKITMTVLLDLAVEWKLMPEIPNPTLRIPIERASERQKERIILTQEQVLQLASALQQPHNLMVLVTAVMGFRIEETVALQWTDFDFQHCTVKLQRAYTHGQLGKVKTKATGKVRPVNPKLLAILEEWKKQGHDSIWVFPSPMTGGPYCANTIQQKYLRPLAKRLFGVDGFGWHSLRHSHNSWLKERKATPIEIRDLMGWSNITTAMDTYGAFGIDALRETHALATDGLFLTSKN